MQYAVCCNHARSEFRREVKLDFREVALCHLQHIGRIGKKHIAALTVGGHKLMFATLEGIERILIVALDPAGLIQRYRLPTTLRTILVQQTVLYDFKLKLSDCAYNLSPVELI